MARVGIVTHVVHPRDGQGRVNYELARYLLARGHAVTLFASEVEPDLLRHDGCTWVRIAVPAALPDAVRWLLFAIKVRRQLGARARAGFDILHLNGAIAPVTADVNTSHFVHASWRRLAKSVRPVTLRDLYQRLVTATCVWCERRAYRSAARVVAVSDVVRDALDCDAGIMGGRVQVIYNGVNLTEFRPRTPDDPRVMRGPLGLPPDALLAVLVGDACSPRKNLDLTMEAIARAGRRFHLAVIGRSDGGPYPALAVKLGIADRTHFLGERADVADCLRDADVVFCPSHYEPASLVLLEAMATGLPVITTPVVGNAAFVVDRRNGYVLQHSTDIDGALQALVQLGDDPALRSRIGRSARETALCLDWRRMGRQYEELYTGLLQERRRTAARGESAALHYQARRA